MGRAISVLILLVIDARMVLVVLGLVFAFAETNFDPNAVLARCGETSLDTFRDELYYHNSILLSIPLSCLDRRPTFARGFSVAYLEEFYQAQA